MSKWTNRFAFFEIAGRRFGFEKSRVEHGGVPYLDRYILYIGGPTLRLHKFWRGDDDRAPHDHPWGFYTFPFTPYLERVFRTDGTFYWDLVPAWRFSYRPATYRHIVAGGLSEFGRMKPFWTFVVTTNYQRKWGFWPKGGEFIYWRDWPASSEQPEILAQRPHD